MHTQLNGCRILFIYISCSGVEPRTLHMLEKHSTTELHLPVERFVFFNEQQRMHKPVSNVAIYLKTIDFSIINMHKKFACPQKSLDITLTNWSHWPQMNFTMNPVENFSPRKSKNHRGSAKMSYISKCQGVEWTKFLSCVISWSPFKA